MKKKLVGIILLVAAVRAWDRLGWEMWTIRKNSEHTESCMRRLDAIERGKNLAKEIVEFTVPPPGPENVLYRGGITSEQAEALKLAQRTLKASAQRAMEQGYIRDVVDRYDDAATTISKMVTPVELPPHCGNKDCGHQSSEHYQHGKAPCAIHRCSCQAWVPVEG